MAHALIRASFRPHGDRINLSHLARAVGVSPQRLHGYWHGRFPWPADVALRVLAASGEMVLWRGGLKIYLDIPVVVIKELGPIVGADVIKLKQKTKPRSKR